jgi:hypothetical protein
VAICFQEGKEVIICSDDCDLLVLVTQCEMGDLDVNFNIFADKNCITVLF